MVQTLFSFFFSFSPASPCSTWVQAARSGGCRWGSGFTSCHTHEELPGLTHPVLSAELEPIRVIVTCTLAHGYSQIFETFSVWPHVSCYCATICFAVWIKYTIWYTCAWLISVRQVWAQKPYDDVCFSNLEPTMNEAPGLTLLQDKSGCAADAVITYYGVYAWSCVRRWVGIRLDMSDNNHTRSFAQSSCGTTDSVSC